jgi:hypothetical protein
MSRPVDCVNKIEISPAPLPLAPFATEFEFRGPLFQSGWSVSLKEEIGSEFSIVPKLDSAERIFPLCFGTGPEEKTLLLGAVPRAEVVTRENSKKAEKRR